MSFPTTADECGTAMNTALSKFDEVFEIISNLTDFYIGSDPVVIRVAIELKVRKRKQSERERRM